MPIFGVNKLAHKQFRLTDPELSDASLASVHSSELVSRRLPEPPSEAAVQCSALLGEAMQLVWNEWCADVHTIPDAFRIHGPPSTRVSATFENSNFAYQVAETIRALGYQITPNAEVSEAGSLTHD